MFTVSLLKPLPFDNPCWQTNELTEHCKETSCYKLYWQEKAEEDLHAPSEYFNLQSGNRERYVQIASRFYAVPGSEIFIDQGTAQLFAARDIDKCMLTYLSSFDTFNWNNALIGAALSGNYAFFMSIVSDKYPEISTFGAPIIYQRSSDLFHERILRAAALGGNENIYNFLTTEYYPNFEDIVMGGNVNILKNIERGTPAPVEDLLHIAFETGKEDMINYLLPRYRGNLKKYSEAAAYSGLEHLLPETNKEEVILGKARAGIVPSSAENWSNVLLASTLSVSPQRYEVAQKALNKGAEVTENTLRNAILTGDADYIRLIQGERILPSKFIKEGIVTGNLEVVEMFGNMKSLSLSNFAASLQFGELAIKLMRK